MPSGYPGVIYVNTTVIAYNPSGVKKAGIPKPTSLQTLTKPAWHGKFSVDPSAVNWYDSLVVSMGHDKALALLKKLGANAPRLVESHTQALTQVQGGEPLATATAYGYLAARYQRKTPSQVAFVNPSPLPSSLNLVDVIKNAPHPAAARLFTDWCVSKAGQQAIVDVTNHVSIRTDVKNDTAVWNPAQWQPAYGKANITAKAYNSEVAEMKSALGSP